MKVAIRDHTVLATVRPFDIISYLRARGWRQITDDPSEPLASWDLQLDGREFEVLTPRHQDWRDYARRVAAVVDVLEEVEQRSQLAILRDLSQTGADVIRIRAEHPEGHDGSVLLRDAGRLTSCATTALLAVACSTVERKRAYHSRKPSKAHRYVDGLRFAQTEHGSFVIAIVSPVTPALLPSQGAFSFAGEPAMGLLRRERISDPFERQVTRLFVEAVRELWSAASSAVSTGVLDAFERAVPHGVSADLCDAFGAMRHAKLSSLSVRVDWALARPVANPPPNDIRFTPDALEVIEEAGRILREKTPIEDFELRGVVTKLTRPRDDVAGSALIAGVVEDEIRQVAVEVSNERWHQADDALSKRSVVRCIGDLARDTKPFVLSRVRSFELIPDADEAASESDGGSEDG